MAMGTPERQSARGAGSHDPADPDTLRSEDSPGEAADGGEPHPMTFSLLGRLFTAPLLIIGTIVGGAVLVVILFGGPASSEERSITQLLQALEATSGEKSLGVLLPREKELWQTALELSLRLKHKDKEPDLTEGELASAAHRLSALVRADLSNLDRLATHGAQRTNQREIRSRRLEFVIRALGRTEHPDAVETLVEIVKSGWEPYVQVAMQELGGLGAIPGARESVGPIVEVLRESRVAETRLLACTVLSVLAREDDQQAIEVLNSTRLTGDAEVAWSAALALARLGSDAGKSTLLDLLDRSFLESGERYHVSEQAGNVHRYPMPPQRVDGLLIAAIDAASKIENADLWEMIVRLESDRSPVVRSRASEALGRRGSATGGPQIGNLEE